MAACHGSNRPRNERTKELSNWNSEPLVEVMVWMLTGRSGQAGAKMMVHVCAFHEVAAPVATKPPYELAVTAAPLSASSATIRLEPDWLLFDRTWTPLGGINDVVVEFRWVQYEIAQLPACGTATTGVV